MTHDRPEPGPSPAQDILIEVDPAALPPCAATVLDVELPPDPANAFLPRQPRRVGDLVGLGALATEGIAIGIAGLVTAVGGLASWQEPGAAFIPSVLAAAALLGAGILAAQVRAGIRERRDRAAGRSRLGLHLVSDIGLLIVERGTCTWVPRGRMPETTHHLGGGGVRGGESRALVLVDGRGGAKTVFVPGPIGLDIDRWRRDATMPIWPPATGPR